MPVSQKTFLHKITVQTNYLNALSIIILCQIQPPSEENPAHHYQVIVISQHWLRSLAQDMIQTLTSHLQEKSH